MNIEKRSSCVIPDLDVVILRGRLGIESTAELTTALQQALKDSARGMILDMSAVDFVSSSGLRVLFTIYKQAAELGKHLAMFHVQPPVYKILKITASDTAFRVHETEEQAARA